MQSVKSEKLVKKYEVDVRSAKSAGQWGGYVRVWVKPILEDGVMATWRDPRCITIAYSVYGRSSGGPKTDLGRALAAASVKAASLNAKLVDGGQIATA